MRKLFFCAILIGASVFAVWPRAALAGGGGHGACAGFAAGNTLVMRDNCFEGTAHFVGNGRTLHIINEGEMAHSFTAVDGSFTTGLIEPGDEADIKLDVIDGIVKAHCTLHGSKDGGGMAGVLVVGDAAATGGAAIVTTGASLDTENPSQDSAQLTADLKDAMAESDQALLDEMAGQSQALADLKAEVSAVKEAVGSPIFGSRPFAATALGAVGVLLGGAALAVVLRRKGAAQPAKEQQPAAEH